MVKHWMSNLQAPLYLSPSSISTFQQCPLKYKLSRIDGLVEPPTEATLRGNYVHSVLEDLYGLPASDRTIDSARAIAKRWWENEYEEKTAPYVRGDKDRRMFRWTSWWCIENLFLMENPQEIHFDGLETELNDDIDGVAIKGFIDRWRKSSDGIIVGDYKTGKAPAPRFQEDKYFQLMLYAVVLEKQLQEQVEEVEILFIKDSVRLARKVENSDREKVKSTVVSVRKQIDERCASGVFEPIKHRLCDWCSFKQICPLWS
jgi:putative RecB family exonuclease